jgi:hypothetical protein
LANLRLPKPPLKNLKHENCQRYDDHHVFSGFRFSAAKGEDAAGHLGLSSPAPSQQRYARQRLGTSRLVIGFVACDLAGSRWRMPPTSGAALNHDCRRAMQRHRLSAFAQPGHVAAPVAVKTNPAATIALEGTHGGESLPGCCKSAVECLGTYCSFK